MGTYAVNPRRSMLHHQLMMYYKIHIQQASVAAYVILSWWWCMSNVECTVPWCQQLDPDKLN